MSGHRQHHSRPASGTGKAIVYSARGLTIGLGLALLGAVVLATATELIPVNLLALAAAATAGLVALLGLFLWRTKPSHSLWRFGTLSGLAALGILGSAAVMVVSHDLSSFFDTVQDHSDTVAVYDVVTLKPHESGLTSVDGQLVADVATDPNRSAVEGHITSQINVTMKPMADPTSLFEALDAESVHAAVVEHNFVAAMADEFADRFDGYVVIDSFAVALPPPGPAEMAAAPTPPRKVAKNEGFIVYLSGIDTYGKLATVSRSDVNQLAAINPKTHQILLVNTPRDYYVQLHGTTGVKDKLTHAGIYGVDMSIQTLEDLYGLSIDYYVRVNFDSLIKLVDTLGGIEVNSDNNFTCDHGNFSFQKGTNAVDGKQALCFARERHSFADGDRVRGQNQQSVIAGIVAKATDPAQILHYRSILDSLKDALGTNLPNSQIASLVENQISSDQDWTIETTEVDGTNASLPTYSMGAMKLFVVEPDMASVATAANQIQAVLNGQGVHLANQPSQESGGVATGDGTETALTGGVSSDGLE